MHHKHPHLCQLPRLQITLNTGDAPQEITDAADLQRLLSQNHPNAVQQAGPTTHPTSQPLPLSLAKNRWEHSLHLALTTQRASRSQKAAQRHEESLKLTRRLQVSPRKRRRSRSPAQKQKRPKGLLRDILTYRHQVAEWERAKREREEEMARIVEEGEREEVRWEERKVEEEKVEEERRVGMVEEAWKVRGRVVVRILKGVLEEGLTLEEGRGELRLQGGLQDHIRK